VSRDKDLRLIKATCLCCASC